MENLIFCAVIVEIDVEQNTLFEMYIYVFLFSVTLSHKPTIENLRIKKLARSKKVGFTKYQRVKTFVPTKYPWEKVSDPQISTRKNLEPT